jgi:hypothetical protein
VRSVEVPAPLIEIHDDEIHVTTPFGVTNAATDAAAAADPTIAANSAEEKRRIGGSLTHPSSRDLSVGDRAKLALLEEE